jgi:hypothetical protein
MRWVVPILLLVGLFNSFSKSAADESDRPTVSPSLTEQEWQVKAVQAYPDLGVRGTALNTAFVNLYSQRKQSDSAFFSDPEWPMRLAKEVAAQVQKVAQNQQVTEIKQRLATIDQQISQNQARAFTPRSEIRNGGYSYSNVSRDFDQLMAENRQLKSEKRALQKQLLKLTGEDTRQPEESDKAHAAADAYIASLKQQGIVFGSEFRTMISYQLFPPKMEAIYTLDYTNELGMRVVGPYTITLESRGSDGWQVIGSSAGDRRARFDKPVVGTDGIWRRSPMEQAIGEAMGR